MIPDCMTPEELEHWREQAVYIRSSWVMRSTMDPCADCTIAFSEEMKALGCCNGVPGEARTPQAPLGRRENNRRAAQRWRARHPGRSAQSSRSVG